MRGKLTIIAISAVLLLGNTGFNFTPVYGGGGPGATFIFDGGPSGTGQDWNTAANWNPDGVPFSINPADHAEIGCFSACPTFNVNIGDGTIPGAQTVTFGTSEDGGSIRILGPSSLTIKEFSTLNHIGMLAETIELNLGATLTVDGTLNNGITSIEDAIIDFSDTESKIVISSTGVLNHDFGAILGLGEIECVGGGTFNENDFVGLSVTVTGCQAPVGSYSIPIDSASLLVADTQSFSWMIPVLLSAIGIGLFVVSRKSK